jgi:hypothetical protein
MVAETIEDAGRLVIFAQNRIFLGYCQKTPAGSL